MIRRSVFAPALLALLPVIYGCGGNGGTDEDRGRRVYRAYCLSCHQADGSGVPGMYPPIQETEWVEGDAGRLIRLVLNGMAGPVEVKGVQYNNIMPAHGHLSDDQVAEVLTFIRQNFGNDAPPITAEDVAAVRADTDRRRGFWSADELEQATGIPRDGGE